MNLPAPPPEAREAQQREAREGDSRGLVHSLATLGLSTARVTRGFAPLLRLLASEQDVILQMLSNTQRAGLVVRRDYLHLSRAVMALSAALPAP